MRFALDVGSEIGQRAARMLLSDNRCERLVLLNSGWLPQDSRISHSGDLVGVDVVVSDGTMPLSDLIGRASVAGVPLVVWADAPISDLGPSSIPVIVGASLGSTLADALLTHPVSMPAEGDTVSVAWTEPGQPRRTGSAVAFPQPIGMAWASPRGEGRFVARRGDEWAGASTTVDGPGGRRLVGVADHRAHLEALTLVAVAFIAAKGPFDSGIQPSTSALSQIFEEARKLELDIAVWRSHS